MLLDYKAVGVDLVIPAIEHDKMRIKQHHSSLTAQMANRNYRIAVGGMKQYNSNNYTFSPRVNCQENGLVNFNSSVLKQHMKDKDTMKQ